MIPEIRPQDKVVFRVQPVFNSGDIVVARIDGEATLKKAITVEKPRSVTLQPINPSYQPITFTGDTVTARAEEGGISRAEWVKQAIREKIKKKEW